ncbi:hypothetical protein GGC47_000581 [Bosea sp. OAE752]
MTTLPLHALVKPPRAARQPPNLRKTHVLSTGGHNGARFLSLSQVDWKLSLIQYVRYWHVPARP